MPSVQSFLDFWHDPRTARDDPAKAIATAHDVAIKALADLRIRTAGLIRPINNGKAWVVGFDPDKIDEVSRVGTEISNVDDKLKSISNDIEEFLSITGGIPVMGELVAERNTLHKRVQVTEKRAAEALKAALARDPHTSPAVLMQRPDIAGAYAAQAKAKEETGGPIADLSAKIGKLNAILDKHRV